MRGRRFLKDVNDLTIEKDHKKYLLNILSNFKGTELKFVRIIVLIWDDYPDT